MPKERATVIIGGLFAERFYYVLGASKNRKEFGFIGGILKKGETAEDAAIRETEEEIGAKIKKLEKICEINSENKEHVVYVAKVTGVLTPRNETYRILLIPSLKGNYNLKFREHVGIIRKSKSDHLSSLLHNEYSSDIKKLDGTVCYNSREYFVIKP